MLFATVEHSGTREVMTLLNLYNFPLDREAEKPPLAVLFTHLFTPMMPLVIDAAQRMAVLTTYRPEEDIRESWVRRGKDLALLDEQLENYRTLLKYHPYVIRLGGGVKRIRDFGDWRPR